MICEHGALCPVCGDQDPGFFEHRVRTGLGGASVSEQGDEANPPAETEPPQSAPSVQEPAPQEEAPDRAPASKVDVAPKDDSVEAVEARNKKREDHARKRALTSSVVRSESEAKKTLEEVREMFVDVYNPDAPPVNDPVGELLKLAGVAQWAVDAMGRRVNALQDVRYMSMQGVEQLRGEAQIWMDCMKLSNDLLKGLAKLDLASRRVELDEQMAQVFVSILGRIFDGIGLDAQQRTLVASVVPRELRALESGRSDVVAGEALVGLFVDPGSKVGAGLKGDPQSKVGEVVT